MIRPGRRADETVGTKYDAESKQAVVVNGDQDAVGDDSLECKSSKSLSTSSTSSSGHVMRAITFTAASHIKQSMSCRSQLQAIP